MRLKGRLLRDKVQAEDCSVALDKIHSRIRRRRRLSNRQLEGVASLAVELPRYLEQNPLSQLPERRGQAVFSEEPLRCSGDSSSSNSNSNSRDKRNSSLSRPHRYLVNSRLRSSRLRGSLAVDRQDNSPRRVCLGIAPNNLSRTSKPQQAVNLPSRRPPNSPIFRRITRRRLRLWSRSLSTSS